MNSIIITGNNAAIVPADDLAANLMPRYIAFIDRCEKTAQTYITNLKQFVAWLRFKEISQPVRADVIAYRDYLLTEHEAIKLDNNSLTGWSYQRDNAGNVIKITCKATTAAQYLRSVCHFFRWAAAEGLYPDIAANIHAPKIRNEAHKKDALKPADVLAIEESIKQRPDFDKETGKRLHAMYLLAVTAGLRTIEIERATLKDLQITGGKAILWVWGKGHSEPDAKKPLAPEVYEAIKVYLSYRTDRPTANSPLFVATGNRSGGKRIAARTISQMLKEAMINAGYDSERLTAHSLRHTTGTIAKEITKDLYTVQKYMRHADPATTERYLHNETETQEAQIAQQIIDIIHGKQKADNLQSLIDRMNPAQREQLATIAAAMMH